MEIYKERTVLKEAISAPAQMKEAVSAAAKRSGSMRRAMKNICLVILLAFALAGASGCGNAGGSGGAGAESSSDAASEESGGQDASSAESSGEGSQASSESGASQTASDSSESGGISETAESGDDLSSETATGEAASEEVSSDSSENASSGSEDMKRRLLSLKIGGVYSGAEDSLEASAHIAAMRSLTEELGISEDQLFIRCGIEDEESCYLNAADLASQGCGIIFTNKAAHEPAMERAAREFPDVHFCCAGGSKASASGLGNLHDFYPSLHEAMYLSGVAAGMKLNEVVVSEKLGKNDALLGFIAYEADTASKSAFSAFYLGALSVCPSALMDVIYTGTAPGADLERESAKYLIDKGCLVVGSNARFAEAAAFCSGAQVPFIGISAADEQAGESNLISIVRKWSAYYDYAVKAVLGGSAPVGDWIGKYADGSASLGEISSALAATGTEAAIEEAGRELESGSLKVFDTSAFMTGKKKLETLISTEPASYGKYGDFVSDGYFRESELRSAPAFDIAIDGISVVWK